MNRAKPGVEANMLRTFLLAALIGMTASLATAAPIVTPLDLNDFGIQDLLAEVDVNGPGTVAVLTEDITGPISGPDFGEVTELTNDPFFGDPSIIVGAVGRKLKFEFDFVEGLDGAIFSAYVFDAGTGFAVGGHEFDAFSTSSGTVTFDLEPLPANLDGYGMSFLLIPFDFGDGFLIADASVTISNLRFEDPDSGGPVVPEPSTWALIGVGAAFLAWRRRNASTR